jgi:hypothetical protein
MKHWTQTRKGKKRLHSRMVKIWAERRNGHAAAPPQHVDGELQDIATILNLYGKLPQRSKAYVIERIQ